MTQGGPQVSHGRLDQNGSNREATFEKGGSGFGKEGNREFEGRDKVGFLGVRQWLYESSRIGEGSGYFKSMENGLLIVGGVSLPAFFLWSLPLILKKC